MFPAALHLGHVSRPESKPIKIVCKAISYMHVQKCCASALLFCFLSVSNPNKAKMLTLSLDNLNQLWLRLFRNGPDQKWAIVLLSRRGKTSSTMGFGMIKIQLPKENSPGRCGSQQLFPFYKKPSSPSGVKCWVHAWLPVSVSSWPCLPDGFIDQDGLNRATDLKLKVLSFMGSLMSADKVVTA